MAQIRPKLSRFAKEGDHILLLLIAQLLALLFKLCQFRRNYARPTQQVERCALCAAYLAGNARRQPQTLFRIVRIGRPPDHRLVLSPEHGLVQHCNQDSGFRLEKGIDSLSRHLRPASDGIDGHPCISFGFEEPAGCFNDSPAGIAGLPLANERFVGAFLGFRQHGKYSILYSLELSIIDMNLVVLGATGGTGLEIVHQALERGHSVTALVRSPDRLKPFGDRIAVRQGSLLNRADLQQAIQYHDAVLSAFGPRLPLKKEEEHLLQQFACALTSAMLKADVRRVVVESVAFLFKNAVVPPVYLLGKLLFPRIVADASAMERVFAESGLDWTMVRPPELTTKPFKGRYRVAEGRLPRFGFKISRADVADFMIQAVEKGSSIHKVVGVAD